MSPQRTLTASRVQTYDAQIHSVELARPLTSLSESVSNSIAPLYSLHIALAQAYGENSQQVQLFSKCKKVVGVEWETWLSFLRECIGYARTYLSLCQSLQTSSPAHNESLTRAVISHLRKICSDIERLRKSYAMAVEQFASLARNYNQPSRIMTSNGRSKARRAPPQTNLPVILQAFAVTMKTLRTSSLHLGDLSAFWTDHASRLSKMTATTTSLKALAQSGRLSLELATWTSFHETLRQTTSNITSYCDAATVTPIIPSSKLGKATINVRFSLDCNATPLDGSERSKIQEAGYYEVLTAPSQYNMSELIKLAMEIHKGVERFASEARQTPKGSSYPLQPQVDKYYSTVSQIEKMAAIGANFYSLLQELGKNHDAAITSTLLSHATTVRGCLHIILQEYDEIHSRIGKEIAARSARDHRTATEKRVPNARMLQDFANRLQQLIQKLVDLDHFWFGLLAGVEYSNVKGLIDVIDRKAQNLVWDRQRVDYERYKNEVQSRELSSGDEEPSSKGWRRFFCLA
ncbi:Fungal N-terminal domain-containing protein [Pleurotus pulmonarius]